MADARLRARLWVQATVRRCSADGITAVVARSGDDEAGAILVKINRLDGTAMVLSQARTAEGRRAWMRGTGPEPVPEAEAESYIQRQVKFDPDIWVVEIEDRQGRHPLDDPIL